MLQETFRRQLTFEVAGSAAVRGRRLKSLLTRLWLTDFNKIFTGHSFSRGASGIKFGDDPRSRLASIDVQSHRFDVGSKTPT